MRLTGHLHLVHRNPGGEILAAWEVDNLIVNEGLATIAASILSGGTAMGGMGLSTSANPPAPGDTYLSTSFGLVASFDTLTAVGNVVTGVATFTGGPPYLTYYTAGLVRSGTPLEALIARALIGAVYLADSDTLTITWVVTISS